MTLEQKIEAILFFKSEPVSNDGLRKMLDVSSEDVAQALTSLEVGLRERGIRLLQSDSGSMLMSAPEVGDLIEKITKEELNKDLGKAGIETLTIVLYKSPVSKSVIDYIRGVNSGFILRNLLIRGLIERKVNPNDKRTFIYSPTLKLFSYLGITKKDELPEFGEITEKIETFEKDFEEEGSFDD